MSPKRQTASLAKAPLIRIIGVDRAMFDLLVEWLTSAGFAVANGGAERARATRCHSHCRCPLYASWWT